MATKEERERNKQIKEFKNGIKEGDLLRYPMNHDYIYLVVDPEKGTFRPIGRNGVIESPEYDSLYEQALAWVKINSIEDCESTAQRRRLFEYFHNNPINSLMMKMGYDITRREV
jgi:hypothetical protein